MPYKLLLPPVPGGTMAILPLSMVMVDTPARKLPPMSNVPAIVPPASGRALESVPLTPVKAEPSPK